MIFHLSNTRKQEVYTLVRRVLFILFLDVVSDGSKKRKRP